VPVDSDPGMLGGTPDCGRVPVPGRTPKFLWFGDLASVLRVGVRVDGRTAARVGRCHEQELVHQSEN
jgi:hypothetical protein